MDRNLALEVVRVTEAAALASARLMGRGDAVACDRAAAEAMHRAFEGIAADGSLVIGEGRAGETERLWVGERIGAGDGSPAIDVGLDALEGATVCATGGANALSIIMISERGRVLPCPETYMEKIATGPEGRGVVSLDKSPTENLQALADAKDVYVEDLTAVILDRPRHDRLVDEVRRAGARVQMLADGDLAAAIATARAIEALGGHLEVRFRPRTSDETARLRDAGIGDLDRIYRARDLVGDNVMFAATGVTGGHLLSGVRFFRGGARTNSVVMRSRTRTARWIDAYHHFDFKPDY